MAALSVVPRRVRLVVLLVGVLALAGAAGVHAGGTAAPSLTLNVNANGALEVVLGNGTRLRTASAPGAVIPPGPYLAIVASDVPDSQDIFHMFHLFGPGVNLSSDLLPCENPAPVNTVTLQPGATYTYEDSRHPDITHVVFTTSASGSSADTVGSAGRTCDREGDRLGRELIGGRLGSQEGPRHARCDGHRRRPALRQPERKGALHPQGRPVRDRSRRQDAAQRIDHRTAACEPDRRHRARVHGQAHGDAVPGRGTLERLRITARDARVHRRRLTPPASERSHRQRPGAPRSRQPLALGLDDLRGSLGPPAR